MEGELKLVGLAAALVSEITGMIAALKWVVQIVEEVESDKNLPVLSRIIHLEQEEVLWHVVLVVEEAHNPQRVIRNFYK